MKGLGIGKLCLQHNIVDCSLAVQLIQTNEAFTVNGRTHTHTDNNQIACSDATKILDGLFYHVRIGGDHSVTQIFKG